MATHQSLPLPPPDDDENDFDTSDVTRTRIRGVDAEIYIGGVERALNAVQKFQVESVKATNARLDAMSLELTIIGREVRETKATGEQVIDEIRKLTKFLLEERAERFALGDRVSTLEQPRKRARRK